MNMDLGLCLPDPPRSYSSNNGGFITASGRRNGVGLELRSLKDLGGYQLSNLTVWEKNIVERAEEENLEIDFVRQDSSKEKSIE